MFHIRTFYIHVIMAGWFYIVLLLIPQLQAQETATCNTPWNITFQNSLYVKWDGADRTVDVQITVKPDTGENKDDTTGCNEQSHLTSFNIKKLLIDPLCSNKTHWLEAGLICEDKRLVQIKKLTIQTDYVETPYNVTILGVTNTSIKIGWDKPYSDAQITAYEVMEFKTKDFKLGDVYHTPTNFFEMFSLRPYTEYFFTVRARTATTHGSWSEIVSERTAVGVPFVPTGLIADKVTNTTIVVKWNEPDPFNGPILSYEIKWRKELDNVSIDSQSVNSTTFKIDDLDPYTEYAIQVKASTEAGSGPWSSVLSVLTDVGIPSVPTNLIALNTTENSIFISWNEPELANGPSLEYVVSWAMRGAEINQALIKNGTEYLANNLKPYNEYMFQVAAVTSAGFGPYTKPLLVWTMIGLPSAPINLTEKHVTNTSITIEWDCPEFPNGPILDYVVQFLESPNGTLMEKNITENSTILENLKPYTLYTIRVAARTETGIGSFTEDLEVQTGVGVPGLPINISAVINATSIILDWDRPEIVPGILMDYQVTWGIRGTPTSLVVIDSNTHHYDAVGLRPYTDYHFEIAARTEAGAGIAETLAIRTGIAAPSSPRKLSVSEKHDSSIHLNWIPPEHPNGPDLIYRVEWIDMANNSAVMETNSTSCAVTSLNPSTNYSIAVMAMTRAAEGPWSESLSVTTNEKRHTRNPHFVLALVLGIMLPLLTILLIVGFIIAKRKGLFDDFRQRSRESSQEMVPQRPTIEMVSNEKIARSFTVHNFIQKVNTITRYGKSGFLQEFEELKRESSEHSTNAAKIEENLIKNRWVKILPFDHSRVKIYPDGTANRSNFINANYIPGENHIIEYIATQGPLPNTVNDFWTVVWQQSVPIVVMLTQCVERAVKNCEKYWPASGENKLYGDIRVQTKQETILTSHIMRVFLVQYQNQQRHIVQMHFTTWPVSGTPRNPVDFLHFIRLVREQVSDRRPGPILVHCSAGVGRTGTFIAVDRLMQHLQSNDEIDIYNTVLEMRRYRPHMVHTMEQYVFIYSCIQQLIQDSSEPQENIYDTVA
ncbi:receptor-type tyrosine-protein phosphatase F-like [Argiope bruennichi]|uniref:receptor-type tyrosine-protein phosphatase F-like n=1 Tax=Argiope bruennichi TaxID=94029 RepID=UPI0024950307|nr:receptor-type tyrosine-protein phosphatase F-like [Argiope bruennichi]